MFNDMYDSSVLEMPLRPKGTVNNAKDLASSARRGRSGRRAWASSSMPAAEAASRIDDHLLRLLKEIATCKLDQSLLDDSQGEPNHVARLLASSVAESLYMAYRMRPTRVLASVEGGIMLTYRDRSNLEIEIEADNEGDVTGVVATDQEVLESSDITLPAEFNRLVSHFRLSAASRL